MKFLYGEQVWEEIRGLARRSRSLVAVVGFVGRRPQRLLPWPRNCTVVADLSEARVREGATSARGALALARRGVEVLSYPGLHSKVFLFDRHAVVGSMNLSEESQSRLEEAAVVLSAPRELDVVRRYVRQVRRNARPEDEQTLRELVKQEPRRRPATVVAVRPRKTEGLVPAGRVWMLPTEPADAETREERRLAEREERKIREEEGVDTVFWYICEADVYRRAKPGEWCFLWWAGTARSLGWLEGPYEIIRPVDLGRGLGDRRYRLACFRRRGQGFWKRLDRRALQRLMRVVADRRSPEEAAEDPLRGRPRLLRPAEKRRLVRLMQRWRKSR